MNSNGAARRFISSPYVKGSIMLTKFVSALMSNPAPVGATSPEMLANGSWSELDVARDQFTTASTSAGFYLKAYSEAIADEFGERWAWIMATPAKDLSDAEREIKQGIQQEKATCFAALKEKKHSNPSKAWADVERHGRGEKQGGENGKRALTEHSEKTVVALLRRWQNDDDVETPVELHAFYDIVEEAWLEYSGWNRDKLYPPKK